MFAANMQTESFEKRTVVVSGVPHALSSSRMIDKLIVHFQSSRRSRGGDVQEVKYPTSLGGVAFVTFDRAEDAERVVQKEHQIMSDNGFPEDYHLTVFPFSEDVYFYVSSATLDLSVFGSDHAEVLQSLRSAHRSVCFRALQHQSKVSIEGPFSAVQAVREDVINRSSWHKSAGSVQTAAVRRRQTRLNLPAASHCEPVSPRSDCSSKNLEPVSSLGLSTPLQTTGETTEVQSLYSNAQSLKYPLKKNLSNEGSTSGSFCFTNRNTEKLKSGRFQMAGPACVITADNRGSSPSTTENRAERTKADREVEISAGFRLALSEVDQLAAEQISTKRPGGSDTSQSQHRPDRISPADTKQKSYLESQPTRKNDLTESDESSTPSLETDVDDTDQLSATSPEELEVDSIWVDSSTFRYIEKFEVTELQRRFSGLNVVMEYSEENDLMQIMLTGRQKTEMFSEVQQALQHLKTLVEYWQLALRVHTITLDTDMWPEKKRLIQICDDVSYIHDDVLYMVEDSCLKVIGPSMSSHQFSQSVKHRITNMEDTFL
ncbi:uncharacterized protein LOC117515295 [Thalassophryne amazonica]|uniref:uncharacterized protein LOC117515295 n=1 Tax=Thalassophryne amazonica TaxID=390379 RepID=UPI001471E0D9|nr:uncharacterized protein LOC117515295 [Thalassophryne amazonica]